MARVYIAGPMTGMKDFNFPLFDEVEAYLQDEGHGVINPARMDRELDGFDGTDKDRVKDLRHYMKRDLPAVMECEAICMLPGWRDSKGAVLEREVALRCGLKDWYWDDELKVVCNTEPELLYAETAPSPGDCQEVRVVDPTTGGQKGQKIERFDLLPAGPLRQVAAHFGKGAKKYADRQWEKGYLWSLSFGALQRHLWQWWNGEDNDPEMGSSHLAAAGFHVLALLEFCATHPEKDDRPCKPNSAGALGLLSEQR